MNVLGSSIAVESRNLMLTYRSRGQVSAVLDKFHLKITCGSVYSLIGPSGCGKTTYLRSLIGLKQVDSGETRLFGLPLGHPSLDIPGRDLGYMPQETALNEDLTIREMISFFGLLYGIPRSTLRYRSADLCKRLGLPEMDRTINGLSGGQQRRVSFICTLIHAPRLMILDEPTVGCDPLVIETMWQCIFEIAHSMGTTVIVTTHYLEEARRTDMIGFMRKGHLLAQGSPEKILDRYRVDSIEKAFAKMVKQDKVRKSLAVPTGLMRPFDRRSSAIAITPLLKPTRLKYEITRYLQVSSAVLQRVAQRYTKLRLHLIGSTLLTLLLASLSAICLGPTPHGLKVGYINREFPVNYSDSFLSSINTQIIDLKEYNETRLAKQDLDSGQINGFLTISSGFTEEVINLITFQRPPTEVTPDREFKGIVTFHRAQDDLISATIDHFLNKALNITSWKLSRRILHHPMRAQAPMISLNPIAEPELTEDLFNSANWFVSVNTMYWSFVVTLYLSIFTFHQDYTNTLYERAISAGCTSTQFILSHLIVSMGLPAFNCSLVIVVIVHVFGATCKGSFLLACTIYFLNHVTAVVTAFTLATMGLEVFHILIIAGAHCYVSLFFGSSQWSTDVMPYFFRMISWIFPTTVSNPAFIRVMVHGDGLQADPVRAALLYSLGYILTFLVILRWTLKH